MKAILPGKRYRLCLRKRKRGLMPLTIILRLRPCYDLELGLMGGIFHPLMTVYMLGCSV